jgi:intracellular multiplication protein IcmW
MPDLNLDAVHAFWDSYDRRVLYRVIVALESVETWAADRDPKIEQAIIQLGKAMDLANQVDFSGYEEKMINMLAYLSASRAIRILQSIDSLKPGTAAKLLTYAEEQANQKSGKPINISSKLFLDRNLVFERMQLLSRIFSIQRVTLILNALEKLA